MKRFLILLGALFIMQTYASLADSANDTIWTRKSHYIINFEFSPTHNYFLSRGSITGSRKGVIILNTEGDTIKVIYESEGLEFRNTQGIWDAHFSNDGKFLIVIWEYDKDNLSHGMIEIFETENWTSVKRIDVPGNSFSLLGAQVTISPDNNTVVAKTMDGLYLYDVKSMKLLKHLWDYGQEKNKDIRIMHLFYSSDGQYIYFNATDNKLRFLNTLTYQIDYTRQDQKDYVQYGSIAVSKSRNLLVNDASKNELRIINTQTKVTIQSIPVSPGGINSLTFSPDEKYLAVNFGQGKVIKVYEISTGNNIFEYNPTGYAIVGIGISPDQKYLVTSSGNIFLYKFLPTTGIDDNPEQKEEIIYPNPTNGIFSIRFNLNISGFSKIAVYDNTGRNVKQVFQGHLERGEQNIQGDIRGLKTGNYFIKVSAPGTDITYKLIINN